MKIISLSLLILISALPGYACTTCNSKQANDVRALVFGDDFYVNVLFTILPFAVFAGIIVWIYKGGKSINLKYKRQ